MFAGEDDSTEPILPASITVGGVSLNILLSSADIGIQTEPPGLEQVARASATARVFIGAGSHVVVGPRGFAGVAKPMATFHGERHRSRMFAGPSLRLGLSL